MEPNGLYQLPTGERNTAVGIFVAAGAVLGIIVASIWAATRYIASTSRDA
jgi:hypothetical protein